jgi:predicted MFS family arabinose efflux permease
VALNSATINFTRVLGPTIGGLLIAWVGVAGAFYLNGATFLGVLYALALMKIPPRTKRRRSATMVEDMVSGLRYLSGHPSLRLLVMLALVPFMLGMPYNTMLTVFAKDVLQVGAEGLGMLTSCTGIGAFSGALLIASRARGGHQVRIMFVGLLLFGIALITFSASVWLPLSAVALVMAGAGQQIYLASNNALVQMRADETYRGRVISTLGLNRSMMPLGTLMAGFGTSFFGVQLTIGSMAALMVCLALYVMKFTPLGSDPD